MDRERDGQADGQRDRYKHPCCQFVFWSAPVLPMPHMAHRSSVGQMCFWMSTNLPLATTAHSGSLPLLGSFPSLQSCLLSDISDPPPFHHLRFRTDHTTPSNLCQLLCCSSRSSFLSYYKCVKLKCLAQCCHRAARSSPDRQSLIQHFAQLRRLTLLFFVESKPNKSQTITFCACTSMGQIFFFSHPA